MSSINTLGAAVITIISCKSITVIIVIQQLHNTYTRVSLFSSPPTMNGILLLVSTCLHCCQVLSCCGNGFFYFTVWTVFLEIRFWTSRLYSNVLLGYEEPQLHPAASITIINMWKFLLLRNFCRAWRQIREWLKTWQWQTLKLQLSCDYCLSACHHRLKINRLRAWSHIFSLSGLSRLSQTFVLSWQGCEPSPCCSGDSLIDTRVYQ